MKDGTDGDFSYTINKYLNLFSYSVYLFILSKIFKYTKILFKDSNYEMTMNMRDFLMMLNELSLVNSKQLSTKDIIKILSIDDPNVQDNESSFNLELEVFSTFMLSRLSFF